MPVAQLPALSMGEEIRNASSEDHEHSRRALLKELKKSLHAQCDYTLPDDVMEAFLNAGELLFYDSETPVTRAGDVDTNLYVVASGIIAYCHFDGDHERVTCFGTRGTLFLSYHSYLFGQGSYYEVLSCCPSQLLVIPRAHLDRIVAESHSFCQWLLRMSQMQLYFFDMKNGVINGSARERYESMLTHRPEIIERVPLKIIASYLGITPQYLSVIRRDYR